jgi:hypothetical protein
MYNLNIYYNIILKILITYFKKLKHQSAPDL